MYQTCQVSYRGEYLGQATITGYDWIGCSNWTQAAKKAAYRAFPQYTTGLYVTGGQTHHWAF